MPDVRRNPINYEKILVKHIIWFLIIFSILPMISSCKDKGNNSVDVDSNTVPIAVAGLDKTVVVGSLVTLDGGGSSDLENSSLTYNWSFTEKPDSSSSVLSDTTNVAPSFVADVVGNYILRLVVNDGNLDSVPSLVVVTTLAPNSAPFAIAGLDKTIVVGSLVTLDGGGSSDLENSSLTYNWSFTEKPDSSSSVLSDTTNVAPSFVADVVGDYVLGLVVNDGEAISVKDEITITVATGVGGVLISDEIWSITNSPYIMTSEVQIAFGTTLYIDAGVRVIGKDLSIRVFGTLSSIGTENKKVKFESLNIVPGNGPTNEWFYINIDYAEASLGSIYYPTSNGGYGSISLRNSVLKNIAYIYLIRPTKDSFFEKNIFINSGGIAVLDHDGGNIYIRNNVFFQSTGDNGQEYAIKNFGSSNTSQTIVEYNSFLGSDRIALMLPSGYTGANITAINNYWNTIDTAEIESMIYDKNDDLGSANYITYSPFLLEPHPDTPDSTPYLSSTTLGIR